MTDKNKEVIVKRKGKKIIKVKGKELAKKFEKHNIQNSILKQSKKNPKYCPNCGSSIIGKSCEMCGAKLD